jgi:regulatory protein
MRRPPPPAIDPAALERAALRYLERFSASRAQVLRVLARRVDRAVRADPGLDRATALASAEAVVAAIVARGLLDDARFAEGRARSLAARGRSPVVIRETLREKGVGREEVARAMDALAEETGGDPALAAALALARRRRLGPWRPPAARAARRDKDLAILARAGFPRGLATRIVDAPDIAALEALRDA